MYSKNLIMIVTYYDVYTIILLNIYSTLFNISAFI